MQTPQPKPALSIRMEILSHDSRSDQTSVSLVMTNEGENPIIISDIRPFNDSFIRVTDKKTEDFEELDRSIRQTKLQISVFFSEHIKSILPPDKKPDKESELVIFYIDIPSNDGEVEPYEFYMDDFYPNDATLAREMFNKFSNTFLSEKEHKKNRLEVLINKLEYLEEKFEKIRISKPVLQPQSSLSRSYIFKFEKALIEHRHYVISFDVIYCFENNTEKIYTQTIQEGFLSEGNSFFLAIIAVVFSFLGKILRSIYDHGYSWVNLSKVGNWDIVLHIIALSILSVIFYFLFDNRAFREKFKIHEFLPSILGGWRLPMIIGFFVGMMINKVIEVLNVLF